MTQHEAGEVAYWVHDEEFERGWRPYVPEPVEDQVRRHATAFLGGALLLPLLGAPIALLWRAVTPRVGFARTASGPQATASDSNQFFAIDGWFVIVSIVVGLVAGGVAWAFLRGRGPLGPVGVAVGGLAASATSAIVGARLVLDPYVNDFCTQPGVGCSVYDGTLRLRAPAAAVVLPVAMLVTFAILTVTRERDPY